MFILDNQIADFFILDDGTTIKSLKPILGFLNQHFKDIRIISLLDVSKKMFEVLKQSTNIDEICLVGLGIGGTTIMNYMIQNERDHVNNQSFKWSRKWIEQNKFEFVTDKLEEFLYYKYKLVFVEDVIASGQTIENAIQAFERRGANIVGVVSALVNENSPALKNNYTEMDIYGIQTCSHLHVNSLDPHWFPPVYSLRHLFYGEDENPYFYNMLSKKYALPLEELKTTIDNVKYKL